MRFGGANIKSRGFGPAFELMSAGAFELGRIALARTSELAYSNAPELERARCARANIHGHVRVRTSSVCELELGRMPLRIVRNEMRTWARSSSSANKLGRLGRMLLRTRPSSDALELERAHVRMPLRTQPSSARIGEAQFTSHDQNTCWPDWTWIPAKSRRRMKKARRY